MAAKKPAPAPRPGGGGQEMVPSAVIPPPAAAPPPPTPPASGARPAVHRAGGWIDRGDGRGWTLEEE